MVAESFEAEQSVLGAILLDNSTLAVARELIIETDFYRTAHQSIFRAMIELADRGSTIDNVTLADALDGKGVLINIGGAAYLAELLAMVPSAANLAHHAKILAEKSSIRTLRNQLITAKEAADNGADLEHLVKLIRGIQRHSDSDESAYSKAMAAAWPVMDEAAFSGPIGELVRVIEPHSEADPVAILVQLIVAFGNVIERGPYFRVEADRHGMNLFTVMVGATGKGRKGVSEGHVRRVLRRIDPAWADERILGGLSSGEGLIWAVRDPIEKTEPIREKGRATGEYQTIVVDPGITDKRLLALEAEFASPLKMMGREGNVLSEIIRKAWDCGNLRALTKNSPAKATGAHVSIIGHVTRDELLRVLDATEAANGFINRFLWVCVRRSKMLPDGGGLTDAMLDNMVPQLAAAVMFARRGGELTRNDEARAMWHEVYGPLSEGKPGLLGAALSRAEAQVMRLACIYALGDMSYVVRPEHLKAALAVWQYCEDSAKWIFGERLGDPVADEIMGALRNAPSGRTRTEIRDHFGRNRKSDEIDRALGVLYHQGLARKVIEKSKTRTAERWFAV
jgi:hypothetical protein